MFSQTHQYIISVFGALQTDVSTNATIHAALELFTYTENKHAGQLFSGKERRVNGRQSQEMSQSLGLCDSPFYEGIHKMLTYYGNKRLITVKQVNCVHSCFCRLNLGFRLV